MAKQKNNEVEKEENAPEAPVKNNVPKYSKSQLLKSSRYIRRRDVLLAMLENDIMYDHDDVAAIIKEFYEREVD
ncbi:MAG: hypothetical protein FWD01_03925 [Defluviitaleaceae bacterium]|nr:hypothetical protein [Defluviitaleaceae bacterium]